MGQCCNHPAEVSRVGSEHDSVATPAKRTSLKLKNSSKKSIKSSKTDEHQPIFGDHSSGSPSTQMSYQSGAQSGDTDDAQSGDTDFDEEDEPIDLSFFAEHVNEFIDFWHHHYGILTREYIHAALVRRIHTKAKEQYDTFPSIAVDEFITTLPDLLETLEILVNIAIEPELEDAVSLFKQYQPLLMSINMEKERSVCATGSGQLSPMPIPDRKRGKHPKGRDSFSIKLTPAYINDDTYPAVTASRLPVPRSPSRSRTRSRSHSKSKSKSNTKSKSPFEKRSSVIITDKDGIDLDFDDINMCPSDIQRKITPEPNKLGTQIVVTKMNTLTTPPNDTTHATHKPRKRGNSLVVEEDMAGQVSPSPDPVADEQAFSLFMGTTIPSQVSFEEDNNQQNMREHIQMIHHQRTHSTHTVEEPDSEDLDDPSVPLKDSTDDIVCDEIIDKQRTTESFGFDLETAEDAEIIMVGIMRTLWFDRIARHIAKCGLDHAIDDLFFLLSNALETAIGTFREYKPMMESFTLYTRQGLRTTLELIRAIINDLPLYTVTDRTEEIYDDPYSILIHFADRCDIACEFWNEHIATLPHDIKQQISMRVYTYSVLNVPPDTYERMKQKGSNLRWSMLLLDFMESVMRFFSRNRHQDLMEYLLILAIHHEKMRIPSTLLDKMGDWLDEAFSQHFTGEEVYGNECSDAIQFVFAFVGEVMRGGYSKPIYDTEHDMDDIDVADEINEHRATQSTIKSTISPHKPLHHIPRNSQGLSEIQFPVSFNSVAQIPHFQDGEEEDLTVHGHFYNNSDFTLNKPQSTTSHIVQGSLTFGQFNRKLTAGNRSVSFGPVLNNMQSMPPVISHLDLDQHPSLTDIVRVAPFALPSVELSLPEKDGRRNIGYNASCPPPNKIEYSRTDPVQDLKPRNNSLLCPMNNLKPPGINTNAPTNMSIPQMIGNSPLSQLESPNLCPNSYVQPAMTPNETLFDDRATIESTPGTQPSMSGDEDDMLPPAGGRAITLHTTLNADNQHKKQRTSDTPPVTHHKTLNVVFKDEIDKERERDKQRSLRARGRGSKKRSFSSADNGIIKYLAPNSQNIYTGASLSREAPHTKTKKAKKHVKHRKHPSRTSSSLLLGKQHGKHWKPMHFLQKIMDLEGRKIISNYAFAPSDGSLSEKIVDLSIFHQYFETAQQFWSRHIDVNDNGKMRNKINDKLLNVFSSRITDAVRGKVSDLLGEKHINFVQMFCAYFTLVQTYLDKCKTVASLHSSINPDLLAHTNASKIPSTMTPSLKNHPRSGGGGRYLFQHKRTFSQRASLSVGLSKSKMRSETTRGYVVSNGKEATVGGGAGASTNTNTAAAAAHSHHHFHNEGQFFVREMLRMGTKHRSHHIEERTLKLVAKCLIEVIEKQFENKFGDKTKRAFTIALKLGIKFMCVEPRKKTNNYKRTKAKPKAKVHKTSHTGTSTPSSTQTKQATPPTFRAKSAQVYGGAFVD